MCADQLLIPPPIRSRFELYALEHGKEQKKLKDELFVKDVRRKFSADWGDSGTNGFAYCVSEEAAHKLKKSVPKMEGAAVPPVKMDALSTKQDVTPVAADPLGSRNRGIGHQRSRSSPAVSTSELADHLAMLEGGATVKLASLSTHSNISPRSSLGKPAPAVHTEDSKGSQEKRSLTPTPSRELLDQKEEANALGSAPHLQPRTSSSPPRTTPRARSKTISTPFSRNQPAPLSLSTSSISKPPPPSQQVPTIDEAALLKGGSLGRSSANKSRGKRGSLNMSALMNNSEQSSGTTGRGRTSTSPPHRSADSPRNENMPGRSRSPPPPTQRFTPPPTVLAPLVATLAAHPSTTPPSAQPAATTAPTSRPRAQTLGAKIFGHKWLKSGKEDSSSNKKLEAVHEQDQDLDELLGATINRLRKES